MMWGRIHALRKGCFRHGIEPGLYVMQYARRPSFSTVSLTLLLCFNVHATESSHVNHVHVASIDFSGVLGPGLASTVECIGLRQHLTLPFARQLALFTTWNPIDLETPESTLALCD